MGITQTAFAEKIGWTRTRVNELIRGKRGITAEAALDLAQVLGHLTKIMDESAGDLRLGQSGKEPEALLKNLCMANW